MIGNFLMYRNFGKLMYLWNSNPGRSSLVTQMVKNLPAMQETWVWSLGWEDSLEKGKATHSSGLEDSTDCIVHGVAKSWTQLSGLHFHIVLNCHFLVGSVNHIDSAPTTPKGAVVPDLAQFWIYLKKGFYYPIQANVLTLPSTPPRISPIITCTLASPHCAVTACWSDQPL